tara:strand:+ start:521 stop:706 length:186 start_codon:yes stop_codon:yes gene_type:complete
MGRSNLAFDDSYSEDDANYALYEERLDRKSKRRGRLKRRKTVRPVRRNQRGFDEGGYEWAC